MADMSGIYTQLQAKFQEWSADSSPLLDGTARPFLNSVVNLTDTVLSRLLEPHDTDAVTLEILQVLCTVYAAYTSRLLVDHLPGGQFHSASDDLRQETASVSSTNVVSERDFAQLDRLLREKPNARTLALEGMVMFANNKTSQWLSAKSSAEQAEILATARRTSSDIQKMYRARQAEIASFQLARLRQKEEEIAQKRARDLKRKEAITKDVEKYGLWTSAHEVQSRISGLGIGDSRAALKAQLQFRKIVLKQSAPADKFSLSKGGKLHSIPTLAANLVSLLDAPTLPAEPEPAAKRHDASAADL